MRFLDLELEDPVPDATTIWLFREALAQAGLIDRLFEIKLDVPGNCILVDHALSRAERGPLGILKVEGPSNPEIFEGKVDPGAAH